MDWHEYLLNFLYPPHCPGCGAAVMKQGCWCSHCMRTVWHPRMIPGSRKNALNGCYVLGDYRGSLRKALIDLKFGKQRNKEKSFFVLLEKFPWWERFGKEYIIVPIPISTERKKERGFDQTDAIFHDYFTQKGYLWLPALKKSHHTLPQSGLSRMARKRNIKDSFELEGVHSLRGRQILLVDDIYTTGYTMREAARVLKSGGAENIVGLVIASGAG